MYCTTRSNYTRANFEVNQTISWKILTDDQCEELFMTTLELLERTGADVLNNEARDILKKAGCWIEGNRVRIPSRLVEWAVRTVPSRLTLCDRNGKRAMRLETTNVFYGPWDSNIYVLDPLTGERRKPTKADVAQTAVVCDSLKNIDFAMSNGLPQDVTPKLAEVHAFEALITNTTKPVVQRIQGLEQEKAIVEMSSAIAGSLDEFQKNPFALLLIQTEGTLVHSEETLAKLLYAAKNGVPLIYATRLIAGDTAPATPAGAIVVALADILVGVLISQLVLQGASVVAGAFFSINDQENGILPYGAPEVSLMGAGLANVLRYLRIPNYGFAGGSDSKISDAQLGLDAAFSILHEGLAGANLIYGCGQLEYGLTGSLEMLVMDEEIIAMVRRIMEGIEVNEERMSKGVIDAVQPGGTYLGEEHTLKYFRKEFWWPTLMNRNRIKDWTDAGERTLGQRVKEKTVSIIKTHEPEKLPEDVLRELGNIIEKTEANLKG